MLIPLNHLVTEAIIRYLHFYSLHPDTDQVLALRLMDYRWQIRRNSENGFVVFGYLLNLLLKSWVICHPQDLTLTELSSKQGLILRAPST